ncbi:hypothetical protein IQ256_07880 [cf. Phormidesmis sp. LEGE 11477]|nr:hypothetical protein [cf. Phormidesmis sp. LEGE 11477]
MKGAKTISPRTLRLQDPQLVQPNLVEGIEGASANPADLINLVDKAIMVWESAFDDSTIPPFEVTVSWADFGAGDQNPADSVLAGSLVGGIKTISEGDLQTLEDLGQSPSTEFPAIEDEALAVHICGAPNKPDNGACSEADRNESTILFNSNLLSVHQIDANGQSKDVPVKLFLDSDPLNSSVFGPIEEIAASSPRARRSTKLFEEMPDAYVVDLFTVALHEVGHAMGYSTANEQIEDVLASHIGVTDMPDVLSPYAPFSTRKCPSIREVKALAEVGSYAAEAPPYQVVSDNPCLVASADLHKSLSSKPDTTESRLSALWHSVAREIPIFLTIDDTAV